VADPRQASVPVAGMLSKKYAAGRAALIDKTKARCNAAPGNPLPYRSDTIYLSAIDADGNIVSLIQSVYQHFGSGVLVDGMGFHLHNRGALFSFDPQHPNVVAPRKRPFQTIIPAFMEKDDRHIGFGIMGGSNQAQAHAQFVSNVADHGMNLQAAHEAPRFTKLTWGGCDVMIEGRVAPEVLEELRRRGHDVVAHLGVDEKAIAKHHQYLTVVADLDRSRVLYLAEDRKEESLDGFWPTLTPAQQEGIQAIAMDMWEPYIQSTREHLEDAATKIVFDKFHIEKQLHEAVDKVRKAEHRTLRKTDDDRLTGTKYLWLMRPHRMTAAQRQTFRLLKASELDVARAWTLKERFRQFWGYVYPRAATTFFTRWFWHATHSRLQPMAKVAWLIRTHFVNILTYLTHHLTNAGLEAVNATIQWVKKTARGFRNVEHFKTAIYFHCGGLDLYPHESR
jgi:transposase